MRRELMALVMATTTAVVTATTTAATPVPEEPVREALQDRLDEVVAAGAVGGLAEVRDGHGVWRGRSGSAELHAVQNVPLLGRFRTGSITKAFVATVTLQLVAEGRLQLDDTVESWLPGRVPDGTRITVRHLLSHTSGLYDYKRTLPMPPGQEFWDNRWRTWTAAELVQRAVANPPAFDPPGSSFQYSNTNYIVLGQIIEEASGRSYGEEIQHRIIEPLGLDGTSVPRTSSRIPGPHPHGYAPALQAGEVRLTDLTEMNPSVFGASGEVISTTRDLNRFFAALLGGRLLPDQLLDQMKTPGVPGGTYGLGLDWWVTTCGTRVYGHDGDALAYQAWSFTSEDHRRQVSLALTPDFRRDPDAAEERVDALLDAVFCG